MKFTGKGFTIGAQKVGGLSLGWSFIMMVFLYGGLSSGWPFFKVVFIRVVFHQDVLLGWSLNRTVFH